MDRPGLLVVDFDDTCTMHDTTTNVILTAIHDAATMGQPTAPLHRLHEQLVADYNNQQQAVLHTLLAGQSPATSFNQAWLEDFGNQLHAFNRRMNDAVVGSGLLRHVRLDSLRNAGMSQNGNILA